MAQQKGMKRAEKVARRKEKKARLAHELNVKKAAKAAHAHHDHAHDHDHDHDDKKAKPKAKPKAKAKAE